MTSDRREVPVRPEEFVARCPRLFHMADAGAWAGIRAHGLRSTRELVTTSGLDPRVQEQLLGQRRLEPTVLQHPVVGRVWIRDQRPLRPEVLAPALMDLTVPQWLAVLNERVFLWPSERKLRDLLAARRYREREQDVLTIDTAGLLAAVGDRMQLSPINSGAALWPNAARRGSTTFAAVERYDWERQRRRRGAGDAVVEVAVTGGAVPVAEHVLRVERWRGTERLAVVALHPGGGSAGREPDAGGRRRARCG